MTNQWLLNLIAESGHCSRPDATPIAEALVSHIQNDLRCGGSIHLEGVGTWSVDWEAQPAQVVFTADNVLNEMIHS